MQCHTLCRWAISFRRQIAGKKRENTKKIFFKSLDFLSFSLFSLLCVFEISRLWVFVSALFVLCWWIFILYIYEFVACCHNSLEKKRLNLIFVGSMNLRNFNPKILYSRTLHNYILWRLVMSIMPHMIDDYQQKRIEFRKILLGILSERNRWSQCVEWTNKKLGMAVGALFIRDNFNHESKVSFYIPKMIMINLILCMYIINQKFTWFFQETALEMIRTIREAFNELLAENHWMNDETRAVAKKKADSMNERIGYPEFLKDPVELSMEYVMVMTSWLFVILI